MNVDCTARERTTMQQTQIDRTSSGRRIVVVGAEHARHDRARATKKATGAQGENIFVPLRQRDVSSNKNTRTIDRCTGRRKTQRTSSLSSQSRRPQAEDISMAVTHCKRYNAIEIISRTDLIVEIEQKEKQRVAVEFDRNQSPQPLKSSDEVAI